MDSTTIHGPVPVHVAESVLAMLADGKITASEAAALLDGARTDGNNPDLYECDRCGLTGTETEVDAHTRRSPDGTLKDPADDVCYGGMLVGGRAWVEYHTHGRRPMSYLVNEIRNLMPGRGD